MPRLPERHAMNYLTSGRQFAIEEGVVRRRHGPSGTGLASSATRLAKAHAGGKPPRAC